MMARLMAFEGTDSASSLAPGHLAPGTVVAERYRIEHALGEGGMGIVYLAEHVAMRKTVALKVLHADSSQNAEVVTRFEREAVAAASIDHQHVAAAIDFGALPGGSFFLVLEYVPGRSLRVEIEAGPLPPARTLAIMRGIVAGLAAAHARGIVHRDLKPENVMLTERDGNADFVKVLDFGIAKLEEPAEPTAPTSRPLTRIGAIMGTPNYMSPEQAIGQPCDARADIYALGVVFYEMLTGSCLFDGDPILVLAAHVTTPPPPLPPEVLAALGPHAQAVFDKLLAKSPDDRYQSAVEFATALEMLGEHVSPSPPNSMRSAPSRADARSVHDATAVVTGGSAPTLLAGSETALAPVLAATVGASDPSQRMLLGAALGVAALGLLVLLVYALGGSSESHVPIVAASPSASSAASAASAEATAELPPIASSDAKPVASTPNHASGGKGKAGKGGRKTGPGGLYVPPPSQWFK